jgi:hypothetical protein
MPAAAAMDDDRSRVEVTTLAQDLAAVAPSVIVCLAFLIGLGVLLRRELGPKRRAQREDDELRDESPAAERSEGTES